MDTTTEARVDTRELTATEVEIATAQIVDRMTRATSAAVELFHFNRQDDDETGESNAKKNAELRNKYDIPEHVDFYLDEAFLDPEFIPDIKPFVRHWVSGTLSVDEMHYLEFFFELNEIDYCWCFMEKPSFFYEHGNTPEGFDYGALVTEWMRIGSRAKKKHRGKLVAEVLLPDYCDEKGKQKPFFPTLGVANAILNGIDKMRDV